MYKTFICRNLNTHNNNYRNNELKLLIIHQSFYHQNLLRSSHREDDIYFLDFMIITVLLNNTLFNNFCKEFIFRNVKVKNFGNNLPTPSSLRTPVLKYRGRDVFD